MRVRRQQSALDSVPVGDKRGEFSLRAGKPSDTNLESTQLSFQVLQCFRRVISVLPLVIGRTERLEFLDDDMGFVHLGLFSQPFEFL